MVSPRCSRCWETQSLAGPIEPALGSTQLVRDVLSTGLISQFLWNRKQTKTKYRPREVAQVVECLPNRHKALSPHKTKYGGACPLIPEFRRQRQKNQKFKVSLLHRGL